MNFQPSTQSLPAVIKEQPAPKPKFAPGKAPIVPPGSVTGRSLTLVIAIMCFLACLTAGAVYLVNQSASIWLKDLASEVTVQVHSAGAAEEAEKRLAEMAEFLTRQNGIRRVQALSKTQSAELVEPWLGQVDALQSLPVPRLIAIEIDQNNAPDMGVLRAALAVKYEGAVLDDHRHWQAQIRTVTGGLAIAGIAVLILVAAAMAAIIVSAAKSAMASNREIVEVLNFVGAEEKFIVRQFERHFLKLGVKAGVVGAASAAAVFLLMPHISRLAGGTAATDAEIRRLAGGGLDLTGFAILALVVAVIAAICQITSRYGVRSILEAQNVKN